MMEPHDHVTIDEELFYAYQDLEHLASAPDIYSRSVIEWQLQTIQALVERGVRESLEHPLHALDTKPTSEEP